jgi:hypothetical protein
MNTVIDKKQTMIGDTCQVEWGHRFYFTKDGIVCDSKEVVNLIDPQDEHHARHFIVGFMPRTALNFLAWLEQNRDKLEALANEQTEVE